MSDTFVNVNIVLEQTSNKSIHVPCTAKTTAEDVCIQICKTLGIGTLTRHLFALRITGQKYFLMSSATFKEKSNAVDFRIRFKPANIHRLIKIDSKAYDYYFHQARTDVLENKVPDLVYEKCRKELVGLGITDMYRVMLEKDIPRETVETEYKKYIPKEVIKRHQFFIKKPIHDTLGKLQKSGYDAPYVKAEYIKQLDIIAPEYLSEVYKAVIDENGCICNIIIRISPYHPTEPGVKYCYDSKKEKWYVICTIEELGFISIRNDGTVELSRKNGIPFYLKFNSIIAMNSFISALDGYYRLTCKWTFNICKDVNTPSLQKLFQMRCHGPVGGEFSYAKLEEKRNNKPGCFIIRESESKYTDYFIDVCVKDSSKPKTFKLEKICTDEFIFNDDVTRYKSISQLISAYSDPNGSIYLQECLPPSEYDVSPLLLCRSDNIVGDSLTDSSALNDQMPSTPLCINWKDLQVYKGRKCLKWNKLRKKVKKNDTLVVIEKYPKTNFPEHDLGKAKKYCRNPNSNIGGPWCFTENSETSQVEMEYCDIPLCDDVDCLVFTNNNDIYMHYSSFDKGIDNITFSLKLWDPDSFLKASARIVLSTLALPLSGEDIQNAGIGIEIYLSNDYSALTFGNADSTFEEIKTLGILKSTNFTPFSLMWHKGFIELRVDGQKDPIFLMEYKKKKNLVEYKKHKFQYYSITGTNVLWSFPFCIMDKVCDIHTTTGSLFQQFYQLQETETGYDLLLHVRAFHSATILLTPTPAYPYPNIKIIFMNLIDKHSRILVEPYPGSPIEVIIEHELPNLVSYWKWRQFHITIFGSKIQVYVKKSTGNHEIFDVNHPYIRLVRWFSVSSDDTVAHWSFYCKPPDFFVPPPALLPECAISSEELDYEGTQDVTSDGLPCLPWSSKNLLPSEVKSMFSENVTTRDAVNYCRDPLKLGQGTFCYAKSLKSKIHVQKSFCHIRKCKSELCKLAGTGNDFMGVITTTRSNRSCDVWKLSEWENTNRHVWNDTLFPDIKSGNAKNHCRNPSRNIAGAWCYTTDPDILIDACSVKDCDKPEECTVISTTTHKGHKVFILPQWKEYGVHGGLKFAIKEWDADQLDGVNLYITPWNGNEEIQLLIGAEKNEKVILYLNGKVILTKTMPRLLASGSWSELWLQMRKGEVQLGFEGVIQPFFEWVGFQGESFEPSYISFSSIVGKPIGFSFDCHECHTEHVRVDNFNKTYSIGLWSDAESDIYKNLSINLRGTGIARVLLTNLPNSGNQLIIEFHPKNNEVILNPIFNGVSVKPTVKLVKNLYTNSSWSTYFIKFTEDTLEMHSNNSLMFKFYSDAALLFYWFSVSTKNGTINWSANCELLDLDGAPRDGGWSEWSNWVCSVTCGGGDGYRYRTCTNPTPNIFGKLCKGDSMATGRCNEFQCGDISPSTLNTIRNNLRSEHFSHVIPEGKTLVLQNNRDVVKIVSKESPEAYYEWTLNGMYIEEKPHHVSHQLDNLQIRHINRSDSGVYICMLNRINKKRAVVRVFTIAVISKNYDVVTRETRRYVLDCRASLLGYVYSDLILKLLVNEQLYEQFETGMLLSVINSYDFKILNNSHHGDWKCVVEQPDLEISWVTNYVKINVRSPPNIFTNLMEDEMTAPFFSWLKSETNVLLVLIFIVAFTVCVFVGIVFVYYRFCTLTPRGYKRLPINDN